MAFPVWRKKPAAESTTPPAGGVVRRPNKAFTPHPASPPLLQQAGNHAGHAVGLFQHGDASLHQHLLFGHIGRFRRVVGIHNVTDSDFGVVLHTGQVVGGVVQTVDRRTQLDWICETSSIAVEMLVIIWLAEPDAVSSVPPETPAVPVVSA